MSGAASRGVVTSTTSLTGGSELATLVETEARLDRALADARGIADATRAAAQQAAEAATAALDAEIARARERLAAEIATRTHDELAAIDDAARADVARFAAVRGDALAAIARALVDRIAASASEVER